MSITSVGSKKIAPCLWFNNTAKEAADFYVKLFNTSPQASTFPESSIVHTNYYQEGVRQPYQEFEPGKVFNVVFLLAGHEYMAMNGGPMFEFTPAISMMVDCADQEEIDHFFHGLSEAQADRQLNCGWVKDRFGLSWQVIPRYMRELGERDAEKSRRVQRWMMKTMPKKFVIKDLQAAAEATS